MFNRWESTTAALDKLMMETAQGAQQDSNDHGNLDY